MIITALERRSEELVAHVGETAAAMIHRGDCSIVVGNLAWALRKIISKNLIRKSVCLLVLKWNERAAQARAPFNIHQSIFQLAINSATLLVKAT